MKRCLWCEDKQLGEIYEGSYGRVIAVIMSEKQVSRAAARTMLGNATMNNPVECRLTLFWTGLESEGE